MSAQELPDKVKVIRSTAGLRTGEILFRDPRDPDFYTGPAWLFVRVVDVVRGWGFYFAEVIRP